MTLTSLAVFSREDADDTFAIVSEVKAKVDIVYTLVF